MKHTSIPTLSIMPKDHKEPNPETGDPASFSPNGELSHYASDILDAASNCMKTQEVISSEDMLARIDKLNENMKERKTLRKGTSWAAWM